MPRRPSPSNPRPPATHEIRHRCVETASFKALYAFTPRGLCHLCLTGDREALEHWRDRHEPHAELVADRRLEPTLAEALRRYARGHDVDFKEFALDQRGTEFQLAVWKELRRIPRGTTRTYGEVARRIGHPTATRAVGRANAANPLPLVVPCHRVLAVSGLGGFTLGGNIGGVEMKRALLEIEGLLLPSS